MAVDPPVGFLVAAGALVLAPGPDTFYVLDRGLAAGDRRVGLAAAAGVTTGILVHTTGVALGLSALLRASPSAYEVLRIAGAAYLLVLGGLTLRRVARGTAHGAVGTRPSDTDAVADAERPGAPGAAAGGPVRAYVQGIGVNVLNPKVLVFFLAFLPQFAGPSAADLAAHGAWYAVLTMAYLGTVGLSTGWVGRLLTGRPWVTAGFRALSGLVLLGFGAELLVLGVP